MNADSGNKRDRLIEAAAELAHAHGFGQVALADIAERASVPLGNVYYYFKTKASIGEAVIAQRCAQFEQMRADWDIAPTPRDRLKAFVQTTARNRENLARAGCPVGSLASELGKQEGTLSTKAGEPLRHLLEWLEKQFEALGQGDSKSELALHLLAAVQGVSLLANAFHEPDLVEREAVVLNRWIDDFT